MLSVVPAAELSVVSAAELAVEVPLLALGVGAELVAPAPPVSVIV